MSIWGTIKFETRVVACLTLLDWIGGGGGGVSRANGRGEVVRVPHPLVCIISS